MVHLIVAGATFFAPYDPSVQNRDFPLAPPIGIHFVDSQGRFHRPFVCLWRLQAEQGGFGHYAENCEIATAVRFLVRVDTEGDGITHKIRWHLFGVDSPAKIFLLGTDDYGRDQFSRLLHGGQLSLGAGLLAVALSLTL